MYYVTLVPEYFTMERKHFSMIISKSLFLAETVFGYLIVALFWGITNPLMKKGAQGIESVKSSSATDRFFKDVYFLVTNLKVGIAYTKNYRS